MIRFWFEFASTYSYPAVMTVDVMSAESGVMVDWQPFLLGPIFKAHGLADSPFNLNVVKGRYMWRDLERLCAASELPWKKPSVFPRRGLGAARIATVARGLPWMPTFVRAIYHSNFVDDRDIGAEEVLCDALRSAGAVEPDLWLSRAGSDDTKATLRRATDEAVALGIFGAPTFVTSDGELFWGHDRMRQAFEWERRL